VLTSALVLLLKSFDPLLLRLSDCHHSHPLFVELSLSVMLNGSQQGNHYRTDRHGYIYVRRFEVSLDF
jgi:hypothetical protein